MIEKLHYTVVWSLQMDKRVYRGIQSLATVQEVEFHNENILYNGSVALLDELTSSTGRATSSDEIVHNNNTGTRLDCALLDLESVL
jgi:hypothetical protein